MLKFSIWNQTARCEVVSIKMEDYANRKWKYTFCVNSITFQAEPNILAFDLGDSCHMDILRWQRVDSLQFHGLFETVLGLLLADKHRGGKKNHSTHTDGIHLLSIYTYTHTPHSSASAVCYILFWKRSHSEPSAKGSSYSGHMEAELVSDEPVNQRKSCIQAVCHVTARCYSV